LAKTAAGDDFQLEGISNRGVKVYPGGFPETFKTDHWRCRFSAQTEPATFDHVLALLARLHQAGLEVIKTEHLYTFDGNRGYSLGQGE
ncbi:MAG: NADP-dependent isocitrate dehydrogenase, partial [Acidobacteria bacterium]|nr:NADP-dependent isocitrate dehydrogenase [Acidobacteriota bacterium]